MYPGEQCGLDLRLALSGHRFGADYEMPIKHPIKPDEQELILLANDVTHF